MMMIKIRKAAFEFNFNVILKFGLNHENVFLLAERFKQETKPSCR